MKSKHRCQYILFILGGHCAAYMQPNSQQMKRLKHKYSLKTDAQFILRQEHWGTGTLPLYHARGIVLAKVMVSVLTWKTELTSCFYSSLKCHWPDSIRQSVHTCPCKVTCGLCMCVCVCVCSHFKQWIHAQNSQYSILQSKQIILNLEVIHLIFNTQKRAVIS